MFFAKYGRSLAALALLAPLPAHAGPVMAPGDGSWSSNPALFSPVPMADEANWTPTTAVDADPDFPFFDINWSFASKASLIHDASGDRLQATYSPSFGFSHTGTRLSYGSTFNAEMTEAQDGSVNIDDVMFSGTSAYEFDPDARIVGNASLSMTQEDAHASDVATDVAMTPVEISGTADSTFTQKLGRFNVSLKGNAARNVFGPTTLTDASIVDNTSQNNTQVGGGLRVGFELTPILQPFVDAEVQRTVFDAPSASLAKKLDGNEYTLMAGVSAQWETLTASASAGIGLEHFDDTSLADVEAVLYDANLTYKPTEALALTGDFTTSIGAPGPDGSGTAQVEYAANAGATYVVNDWLDWRTSLGWHDSTYAGTAVTDTGYDLGVGADYLVNRHLKFSADYAFAHSEITSSAPTDTHTISVGLTVQK